MSRQTENVNRYRIKFLNPEVKFLIRKYSTFGVNQVASCLTFLIAPLLPKAIVRLDRPIFVIGCSRSGTTVFVDMLREHEDISEWSEAGGVFEPRYFDTEVDHCKSEQDASEFHARRLQVMFGLFTKFKGGKRFLNKHPQNSLRIGFLHRIFPDAKYIHLIREPGATAYSNYSQVMRDKYRQSIPFGSFPKPPAWRELQQLPLLIQFGYQWRDMITHIRTSISRHKLDENYLEMHYEDFCRDPHAALRILDEFCGLDPQARNYGQIPKSFQARNDGWKKMKMEDMLKLQEVCGSLGESLGYDPICSPDQCRQNGKGAACAE